MFRAVLVPLLRVAATVAVMVALSGCYLPLQFDAEAVLTRSGYFDLHFKGDLAWVPLVRDIAEQRIGAEEIRGKTARILNDLQRDPATRSVRHLRDGVFRVEWQRSGDLMRARSVNFVRRSDRIFAIKYIEQTGLVTLEGRGVTRSMADQLRRSRLDITGTLKVKTDARVIEHNANRVVAVGPGQRIYVWQTRSLADPAPKLVIALH